MLNCDICVHNKDQTILSALAGMLLTSGHANALLEQWGILDENLKEAFHADHYFIISVEIVDIDYEIAIRSKPFIDSDKLNFMQVSRYIADSLREYYQIIPFSANGGIYLLGQVDLNNPNIQKIKLREAGRFLLDSLKKIHAKIYGETGICLQLLVGDLVDDIDALHMEIIRMESNDPDEFEPAEAFPQVKFICEQNRIFISPDDEWLQKIPKMELSLCKAAAAHEFSKVSRLFMELVDIELSIFHARKNAINKSVDRLSMIYSLSGTPPYVPGNPEISIHSWITEIRGCITVQNLKDIILTTLAAIRDFHLHKTEAETGNFPLILSYIDKNYTDPSFCCASISEKFDINISTFSRQFKEKTGTKFIDYVHKRRIDLAKEQMEQDCSLRMENIAQHTGYTNTLTFYRAFKRIEGKTPGTYRLEVIQRTIK